jgi:hypothetical protein
MSCPYFYPVTPAANTGFQPGRAPLGVLHEGACHVDPVHPHSPGGETVQEYCNYGYAAGKCERFPGNSEADAVRFSMSASNQLIWILEKTYVPVKHGFVDEAGGILKRQAEVFLENYERRSYRTAGSRINI